MFLWLHCGYATRPKNPLGKGAVAPVASPRRTVAMSESRARLIRVRVSDDEHQQIVVRAERTHCFTLSEYIRRMALHGKIEVRH